MEISELGRPGACSGHPERAQQLLSPRQELTTSGITRRLAKSCAFGHHERRFPGTEVALQRKLRWRRDLRVGVDVTLLIPLIDSFSCSIRMVLILSQICLYRIFDMAEQILLVKPSWYVDRCMQKP